MPTISGHRKAFAGAFRQSEIVTGQASGETGFRGTGHAFALRPLFYCLCREWKCTRLSRCALLFSRQEHVTTLSHQRLHFRLLTMWQGKRHQWVCPLTDFFIFSSACASPQFSNAKQSAWMRLALRDTNVHALHATRRLACMRSHLWRSEQTGSGRTPA